MWGNVFSERPEAVKCSNFLGGHFVFLKCCGFCTEALEKCWVPIRLAEGARRKPLDFVRLFVFFNLAWFWNILALFDKVMVSEVCMSTIGVKGLTSAWLHNCLAAALSTGSVSLQLSHVLTYVCQLADISPRHQHLWCYFYYYFSTP